MTAGLSDEQSLLRETVARLAQRFRADPLELAAQRADDSASALLVELGLPAMRLPEEAGGSDATMTDVALVAEGLARTPAVCPFLGPVLAAELLVRCGAPEDLLRRVAAGEARLTVGLAAELGSLVADPTSAVAWDAAGATHAVSLLPGARSGAVRVLALGQPALPSADLTRVLLPVRDDRGAYVAGWLDDSARTGLEAFALALLAADLLGIMDGALELATAYVCERKQFGRPIGSFQSIQHLLADAWVSAAAARSVTYHAAWSVDASAPSRALLAARAAKAYTARAAVEIAEVAMQVHGAMGNTWESTCHVFLRRALLDGSTLGGEGAQVAAVTDARLRDRLEPAEREDEHEFREGLRQWLREHASGRSLPHDDEARSTAIVEWQHRLYEGGWAGLSIPEEYGGGGRSPLFEGILNEEIAAAGAPPILDSVYLSHVVLAFGDEEQRRRWIPRMINANDWWCQGFSEPEAGSDLASLRTRALKDGDDWILSGQKTWTTSAQWATHCLLLARTDPDAPRHRGISAFVVPMDSPGLAVRPIRQPTGQSEFAEVFLDGVRVRDSDMLGDLGDGWKLAMATVTLERGPSDSGYAAKHLALLERLEAIVRGDERLESDQAVRRALGRAYVDVEVLRLSVGRSLADRSEGRAAGPESSADKLLMIRTEQALHHLAIEVMGQHVAVPRDPQWLNGYLASRAASVYGGTEQIQKDIVATRVMGLPRG
jgi:alkylation response protein AidB-like acyl-CoA dehydrogenase